MKFRPYSNHIFSFFASSRNLTMVEVILAPLVIPVGFRPTNGLIVSNPPYIPSAEIPNLMPEVRDFEPHQALDGLEDGLYFYRKIIAGSVEYLNEDGILCLEIGCEQASAVTEMMKHFGFKDITVVQDLAGLDRVVRGHL